MEATAREGAEVASRLGQREQEQQLLSFVAYAAWMLGDWATCDSLVDRFDTSAPYPTLFHALTIVYPAIHRGAAEVARSTFDEAAALRDSDDAQIASGVHRLEGLVLQAEGRPAEAAAALRASQDVEAAIHPGLDALTWGFELDALADAGDTDGLEERIAVVDTIAAVQRTPLVEASHARAQGRLLALRGDRAGAVEALAGAAKRFAAQDLRFYEAATLVELAEVAGTPVAAEVRATLERLDAKLAGPLDDGTIHELRIKTRGTA
jgi:hypothetical protein